MFTISESTPDTPGHVNSEKFRNSRSRLAVLAGNSKFNLAQKQPLKKTLAEMEWARGKRAILRQLCQDGASAT